MPRLFMSYARETRPHVERLAADLRSSGYDPFFDEQLVGGQNWWTELLTRIEAADAFMPVLESGYLNSTPCQLEAAYAAELGKPFLPVAIENLPPQLFSRVISEAHWATYDPQSPPSVLSVIRAINALPPPPPLPEPRPERPRVPISYMTELQEEIAGDEEVSRARQLQIVADLRSRMATDDREAATLLLRRLRQRSDVGYQVAMDIDELVAVGGRQAEQHAQQQPQSQPQTQQPQSQQPQSQQPQAQPRAQQPQSQPQAQQPQSQAPQQPTGPTYPQQPPPRPGEAPPAFSPNQPMAGGVAMAKPDNYLVWTILSTLLCCPGGLLGIVGIVQSVKVDPLWTSGQYAQAVAASKRARTWAIVAAGSGVVFWMLYLLIGAIASSSSTY